MLKFQQQPIISDFGDGREHSEPKTDNIRKRQRFRCERRDEVHTGGFKQEKAECGQEIIRKSFYSFTQETSMNCLFLLIKKWFKIEINYNSMKKDKKI